MSSIAQEFKAIAWIAIPRTGTNFLCSLLRHHPGIISYYEIFHRTKFYVGIHNQPESIIENINQKYHLDFSDIEAPGLVDWINQHPQELLTTLIELNPQHLISFKLFPNQLKLKTLQKDIIKNDRIAKILVKRNLLDTYISHEIARQVGLWDNYDTSNISLTLSVEKFIQRVEWAEEWYGLFENNIATKQITCSAIDYETIHQQATNTDKLVYLDKIFHHIGIDFTAPYSLPDIEHIDFQKKQDNRTNLADKIINYDEFIEELKKTKWYHRIIKT